MTRIRRLPAAALTAAPALAVLAGTSCAIAGLYLLAGLAWAMVAGGVLLAAAGLVVDLD